MCVCVRTCVKAGEPLQTEFKLALLIAWQANESARWGVEARNTTLFGKSADWEDGRLVPQNNHLVGVWMPRSFVESEWKKQWGSKEKVSSVLQNISKGMASLSNECVNLFFSQVGSLRLSLYELNKGTLIQSDRGAEFLWSTPLCMIIIAKATTTTKKSQKNSFQHGVRIGFFSAAGSELAYSLQQFPTVKVHSTIL